MEAIQSGGGREDAAAEEDVDDGGCNGVSRSEHTDMSTRVDTLFARQLHAIYNANTITWHDLPAYTYDREHSTYENTKTLRIGITNQGVPYSSAANSWLLPLHCFPIRALHAPPLHVGIA